MLPCLEFQPSVVHAPTKRGSRTNQGSIFLNLTWFKGVYGTAKLMRLFLRKISKAVESSLQTVW